MTLAAMRLAYPEMFYRQDWFVEEDFMHAEPEVVDWPRGVVDALDATDGLKSAATLAMLYLAHPGDAIWSRYLLTSDTDQYGDRIYVVDRGKGLEIHRDLQPSRTWGILVWH